MNIVVALIGDVLVERQLVANRRLPRGGHDHGLGFAVESGSDVGAEVLLARLNKNAGSALLVSSALAGPTINSWFTALSRLAQRAGPSDPRSLRAGRKLIPNTTDLEAS